MSARDLKLYLSMNLMVNIEQWCTFTFRLLWCRCSGSEKHNYFGGIQFDIWHSIYIINILSNHLWNIWSKVCNLCLSPIYSPQQKSNLYSLSPKLNYVGAFFIVLYYNPHINLKNYKYSKIQKKKSRIRETPTLSTDADSRTDTNLKRLRNLSIKN